jgi:PAS domain S-box-containing protein
MGTAMKSDAAHAAAPSRTLDIDAFGAMIAIIGSDLRHLCVSESYAALLGRERAAIEGQRLSDILQPELLGQLRPYIDRALAGAPVDHEIALDMGTGRVTHLAFRYLPVTNDGAGGFVTHVTDVTVQRRVEYRLATKDAITQALWAARGIPEAAAGVLEGLSRYLGCPAACLWLVSDDDRRMRCARVHAADDALRAQLAEASDGDIERGEGVIGAVWEGGRPVVVAIDAPATGIPSPESARAAGLRTVMAFPVALEARRLGVLAFFLPGDDPSDAEHFTMLSVIASQLAQFVERVRIEGVLRESELRLMLLTDLVPQLIWSADRTGEVDFYSSRRADYEGFSRNADGSWNWMPVVHPDDASATAVAWRDAVRTGAPYEIEHRIAVADGSFRWHLSRALPLRDESGTIMRWYGSATDIHALKSAQGETEGLLSERQVILETMAQGLAVIAPDGVFTYINPAGRRILGLTDADPPAEGDAAWIGERVPCDLDGTPMPPDLMPHARASRGERVRGQMVRMTLPGGAEVVLGCDGEPLRDADGAPAGAIVTFEDVTGRQAAEERLRQSEERLKATFEGVADGIITFDAAGRIINFNHAFARMHGFPGGAETLADCDWYAAELEVRTPDGQLVPLTEWPFRQGLRGEVVKDRELHVSRRDNAHPGYIGSFTAVPIRRDDGEILQVVVTIRDITERSRAQRRHDLMTREVNHRARNALAVVQAITRLTRAETVGAYGEAVRGRVEALVRSHTRLADSEWQEVPLRDLVADELRPYTGDDGTRLALSGDGVRLAPEAVQPVSMALHELATNAAKYGALSVREGRIRVETEALDGGRFRLVWIEEGGPPVAHPPKRRGVGLEVIRSVAAQLGGAADILWERGGIRCDLTLGLGASAGALPAAAAETPAPPPVAGPARLGRVLVVEDDALIAADLAATLADLDYDPVGPAATVEEAFRLADGGALAAAVLDVNVGGTMSLPLARALARRGVPVIFASGYAPDAASVAGAQHLQKPYTAQQLDLALKRAIAPRSPPDAAR